MDPPERLVEEELAVLPILVRVPVQLLLLPELLLVVQVLRFRVEGPVLLRLLRRVERVQLRLLHYRRQAELFLHGLAVEELLRTKLSPVPPLPNHGPVHFVLHHVEVAEVESLGVDDDDVGPLLCLLAAD